MRYLVLLLLVSACGRWGDHYQPPLASAPKNPEKYEADRKACIAFANTESKRLAERPSNVKRTLTSIPVVGIGAALYDHNDPSHVDNTPMGITDRCMAEKGHDVVIEKHCC